MRTLRAAGYHPALLELQGDLGRTALPQAARTRRKHRLELLNWFGARGKFAAGATEGFNNKELMTTRKAYGFRYYEHAEIALYHVLGDLAEPDWLTHRFA